MLVMLLRPEQMGLMTLVFFLICLVLGFGIFLMFRANRTKKGSVRLGLAFLIAEIVTDGLWLWLFVVQGNNYGLGGSYLRLLLWPLFLLISGVLITVFNSKNKNEKEEKQYD